MREWTLYAARGIVTKGQFDPSQIDAGLEIGLQPQIQLPPEAQNPDIVSGLFDYLKAKELAGIPIKITAHGRGEGEDFSPDTVGKCIDAVVELNKRFGRPLISEMVFHAGAVHSVEEEYRLRKQLERQGLPYRPFDATFSAVEYKRALERNRANVLLAADYARDHSIQVIIENVGQINFGFVASGKWEDKPEDAKREPRWGNTLWLNQPLQSGELGCVYDIAYLTQGKVPVCIDVEHLAQSVEYSTLYHVNNFPVIPDHSEAEVFKDFGVFIREGMPIVVRGVIDPVAFIQQFQGRIPICHLGGQVTMLYEDGDITKIGSHMPITFGHDPNEFIANDALRREHNKIREEQLRRYITALHEAGCRQGVFEIHVGQEQRGKKWKFYYELSARNVRQILEKL